MAKVRPITGPRIVTPQQIYDAAVTALERRPAVSLTLKPIEALSLIGTIELALRHPANTGPSSKIARDIVSQIQDQFKDCPEIMLAIDMGKNPQFDTPREAPTLAKPTLPAGWIECPNCGDTHHVDDACN